MNVSHSPEPPLGQSKRLAGSMVLILGVGVVLDTSYQWAGISIILAGITLVVLGWKKYWTSDER